MAYSPQHLDRLRLRHLRLLELIDRERSLRSVGNVLNLTQPAVSQMVKDLEQAFGVTLVDRSARGVSLSAAGRQALQRVRSGLATFDHLAEELQARQPLTIRIGTNPALMFRLLPHALSRLDADHGDMRFRLRTGIVSDMMQALLDGHLDCYVGRVDWDQTPPHLASALIHDPLTHTDLVIACSATHPLANRRDLTLAEILQWPWALPAPDSNNRIALEAALRNHGLSAPEPMVEAADPHSLINLTRQMDLLTIVARVTMQTHVWAEELRALDLPDLSLPPIQISFVTLDGYESMSALQRVRQALREAYAEERDEAPPQDIR